jgi:hypothetical protein
MNCKCLFIFYIYSGQILRYDVSGSKCSQLSPRFEQGHSRIAFTLCHAGAYHIVTSSLDGQVRVYYPCTKKN